MEITTKQLGKFLRWVAVNGLFMFAFTYGNYAEPSDIQNGLYNVGLFGLWLTSILALMMFSEKMAFNIYNGDKDWDGSVPRWLDYTFDFTMLITIVYFGHIFLAIFYFIHILGNVALHENIKKIRSGELVDERDSKVS